MPNSIEFLAVCFYFILPAYVANVVPVLAQRFNVLPKLAIPIDCNARWKGRAILGPNKTMRGFLFGTAAAVMVTQTQAILYPYFPFPTLGLVNYAQANPLMLGFLLGFGSLVGDSLGSFIKRRMGKRPGEHLLGVDEIGMAVVPIACVAWLYSLSFIAITTVIVMTFLWHITAAQTAYHLRIREEKW